MRLVHVYHDAWPVRGGIEDMLGALSRAQVAQGLAVTVLCANNGPRTRTECVDGVQFVRAASFGRYFAPFCPSWPFWLQRLRPNLVHIHLPSPLAEWAVWLARGRRVIVSLHNDYVRPRWAVRLHQPMHMTVLRNAKAIIVAAPDYARSSAVLAELQTSIRIVPYGIDGRRYSPRGDSATRPRQGVLSAGRLCYYKGIEVLLEAASGIDADITIAGDGPWSRRLRAQAAHGGLDRHVRFVGAVSEDRLVELMQASRVFAFPSTQRSESFGLSQLKAMASGLPVVSSDLPGVAWLNLHGETGLTVPPHDAPALAEATNRLLGDDGLRKRLAEGAQKRSKEFGQERMVEAIGRVYAEVLDVCKIS